MAIDQAKMIDQIAAKAMGVPPAMPADPPAMDAASAPPPPPPPPAADKTTPQEAAVTAGAPVDENGKMAQDPIAYEVDFGGKKRRLTPEQIVATFDRYGKLNHQHARMKPVIDLVEQIMEANPGSDPGSVAEYVLNMARERNSSAAPPPQPNTSAANALEADRDPLAQWEKENAATLPPGYKDMMTGHQSTAEKLDRVEKMLQQVLAASSGHLDAARAAQGDVRGQKVDAIRQSIANNLDRAQAELQLRDEQAEDFMTFASERGYTMEDFIDPMLVRKVMGDFKANVDSPEMERLRAIAQRRQAFTGTMGSSPSGPAAAATPEAGDPTFNKLANYVMGKRVG